MIKYFVQKQPNFDLTFEQKTEGSSGFDLHACCGTPRELVPGQRFIFNTGVFLAMPRGVEAQVRPRSGLVRDYGIGPLQGTVDSDYRGEIKITLFYFDSVTFDENGLLVPRLPYVVNPGDRIAQLAFSPVYPQAAHLQLPFDVELRQVMNLKELGSTGRGDSGHGSTGR